MRMATHKNLNTNFGEQIFKKILRIFCLKSVLAVRQKGKKCVKLTKKMPT